MAAQFPDLVPVF